jgi:hypothetical protein
MATNFALLIRHVNSPSDLELWFILFAQVFEKIITSLNRRI